MKKRVFSFVMALTMVLGIGGLVPEEFQFIFNEQISASAEVTNLDIVAMAKSSRFLGSTAYYYGNTNYCLGLVDDVYAACGLNPTRYYSARIAAANRSLNKSRDVPLGAQMYFNTASSAGHVAIYIGDNQMIHADGSVGKVVIANINDYYWGVFMGWSFGEHPPTIINGFQPHVMAESEASGRTIADGDYWIKCKCASNSFVDFPGSFTITGDWAASNNCNATAWPFDGNPTEYDVFTVTYLNNGFYSIKQKDSDVSLDVENSGMTPGTNVKGWKYKGNNAQQWSIDLENNGYRIRSRCNAMSLDVSESKADGNLTMYTPHDGLNQKYDFIPFSHELTEAEGAGYSVPEGEYWIKSSLRSDYYVDIPGTELLTSDDDYTNVQMWLDDASPILQTDAFVLDYLDNGFYSLRQKDSDMYLTVEDNAVQGSQVKICSKQGSTLPSTQQWSLVETENAFYLRSRSTSLMMDSASGGGVSYGNKLLLWGAYNGANQKFAFVPAETDQPLLEGDYYIRSALSNDTYLGSEAVSDASFLCVVSGADKVKYKLEYEGDGIYVIKRDGSDLCLSYNYKIPGGFAWCYEYYMLHTYSDKDNNIRFKLKPNGDGTYKICNMLGGMPLDVLGGNTAAGTRIVTYNPVAGSKNQAWVFERATNRKKGDVNNNGKIDAADLLLVKSHIKKAALLSGDDLWCADVDDNGIVNAADLLKMKSHIKGVSLLWK